MVIEHAAAEHLPGLIALFDQYRVFYHQPSDPAAAEAFLAERLAAGDSTILVALEGGEAVGFTQLGNLILNDLYVAAAHRRGGVARELMEAARKYAADAGAAKLELATQIENTGAQRLYESLGYVRDTEYYHYSLSLQG